MSYSASKKEKEGLINYYHAVHFKIFDAMINSVVFNGDRTIPRQSRDSHMQKFKE